MSARHDEAPARTGTPLRVPATPPAAIQLERLGVAYRGQPVIRDLSGAFEQASLTAIIGPNGCGKSTLLKTLIGQLRPAEGRASCLYRGRDIAYLAQLSAVERGFPMTVGDFVALGHWQQTGWWRALRGQRLALVSEAVAAVGLRGMEQRWIGELSGGQFQRMRFARLLVQDAPLVLLDEPFTGVDAQTTEDLLCLIDAWHVQGKTVAAVLHDLNIVQRLFPLTLSLEHAAQGQAQWDRTERVLARRPPTPLPATASLPVAEADPPPIHTPRLTLLRPSA